MNIYSTHSLQLNPTLKTFSFLNHLVLIINILIYLLSSIIILYYIFRKYMNKCIY